MSPARRVRTETPIALWPHGADDGADERADDGAVDAPDRSSLFSFPGDPPGNALLRNVTRPTLTPYLPHPHVATGCAVVVCPGGAHQFLSVENEGSSVATWLAERGVAAFVLHYRVLPTGAEENLLEGVVGVMSSPARMAVLSRRHRPVVVADGTRALALVREGAARWDLDPERIGILGFSAGGHVAVATTREAVAGRRPAFCGSIYGAAWDDVVPPADAPPLFAAWATDDQIGEEITLSGLDLVRAWTLAGHSVEAHVFAAGGHGFGMRRQGLPSDHWPDLLLGWLAERGLL